MATSISLIRHGEVCNPRQIYYGRLPHFPLSEEGVRQAALTASTFRDQPIRALFSSPMLRTRQTASAVLALHADLKLRISSRLNEVHSPFDGRLTSELSALGWDIYTGSGPDFEQPRDVLERTLQFLKRLRRAYANQHVIAVTHGDVIALTTLWAKGAPITIQNRNHLDSLAGIQDPYPEHASVTTLTFQTNSQDEKPTVVYRNHANGSSAK